MFINDILESAFKSKVNIQFYIYIGLENKPQQS